MLIEVFADFSCPWCFIGRRRLERARQLRPTLDIEVVWQPFQLNPELPAQGVDRAIYLRAKFGDRSRIWSMETALAESGEKEGIAFAFDRIRRTPNTLAAHRLSRFAAALGKQEVLADLLFSAYFENGLDIGDIETLIGCAAAAGLDGNETRILLESEDETDAVLSIDELGRQNGITGVPYFIFDRRYALAGAQEPAAFLPLFDAVTVAG
jgi:predicted DsbA family dithiol-disulfide isomerase